MMDIVVVYTYIDAKKGRIIGSHNFKIHHLNLRVFKELELIIKLGLDVENDITIISIIHLEE
jgi:hypothetical protein